MSPEAFGAFVVAGVLGVAEGLRRIHARAQQRVDDRVQGLGRNLGPKSDDLLDRVAYIEGHLGIQRAAGLYAQPPPAPRVAAASAGPGERKQEGTP